MIGSEDGSNWIGLVLLETDSIAIVVGGVGWL